MKDVRILNGEFAPVTLAETLDRIFELIEGDQRGYLCTVNVAILMMMQENPRLQRFADNAAFCVADGTPLVWASKLLGRALPERVAGVDLVDRICARAARQGIGVFLLGATSQIVNEVASRLIARFEGLKISGVGDGYFGDDEAETRVRAVRESGAKILIVGMGVPRQEYFIEDQWEELGVNFAIGVGGSFDVLAGVRKRAPKILQKTGLEWAFRAAQEPRRLLKRYLVTNTQFIYRLTKELIVGRK